jgi:uncharacterized protein (TIGR00255 family)
MKSMTAYAKGEKIWESLTFTLEIRTLNHRYRDIVLKVPQRLFLLEERIKRLISTYIQRGRVDCIVKMSGNTNELNTIAINWEAARAYKRLLELLKAGLSLKGEITIDMFLGVKDIFTTDEKENDTELLWPPLEEALREVLEKIDEMRKKEGENLKEDLEKRLKYVNELVEAIENQAPKVIEHYRQRLKQRIKEFIKQEVDENRLLQEVVFLAERSDITEEIVRFKSHLKQFANLLNTDEPIGRKLDFLLQEMHREINTLGVKANDTFISQQVVEIKTELEKMRQQVQNIE